VAKHILAIDQGTTGTTVMVLDEQIRVVGRVTREFPQIYPKPGWVEHDPEAIWESVTTAVQRNSSMPHARPWARRWASWRALTPPTPWAT